MKDRKAYKKQYHINNKEHENEYSKRYNQEHKGEIREYSKQWRIDNKEYQKQYYLDNKEQISKQQKQRYIDNPEKRGYDKQYRIDNKEQIKEVKKQYRQTETCKATNRRSHSKRRSLGFLPLNEPFDGCEGHHISENFIIYIPKEVHKCLYHSIWTWQNMEQMNKSAIEFV